MGTAVLANVEVNQCMAGRGYGMLSASIKKALETSAKVFFVGPGRKLTGEQADKLHHNVLQCVEGLELQEKGEEIIDIIEIDAHSEDTLAIIRNAVEHCEMHNIRDLLLVVPADDECFFAGLIKNLDKSNVKIDVCTGDTSASH